jgi:hypothetical protein
MSNSRRHEYAMLMAMACLTAGTVVLSGGDNTTDCCGISGVVGTKSHDARYAVYYWLFHSDQNNTISPHDKRVLAREPGSLKESRL